MSTSPNRTILTNEDDDAKVDVETRGTKDVLAVEVLDASGNQITNFIEALSAPVTTALTLTTVNTQYKMPASELASRRLLVIYNVSDTSVFIGSSSVTTTTGILLEAGGVMTIDSEKDLYAVCGTAGKIINLLELS